MTNYEFDNNMSDKEFATRLTKCLIILSDILPIYEKKHQASFRLIFGKDMTDVIPQFLHDLSIQMSKTRQESTPYLIYCKQALDYTLGYSEKMPDVDYPTSDYEKLVEKRINGLNLNTQPHVIED